ncbi:hypothetical protein VF21_08118, partial [Pseudogymnoascus sp. 05NY08]
MGQALSTPEPADSHPDQPRWENPGGWGARHISDTAPFNLWTPGTRQYRMPNRGEYEWCKEKFGDGSFMQPGWFTAISSSSPPPPGRRAPVKWGFMEFPTKDQNKQIVAALEPLANVRRVVYMPYITVAELEVGDGRVYKPGSLPGRVGGWTMLYHHAEEPFLEEMKEMVSCPRLKGADSGNWFDVGAGEVAMLAWAEAYAKPQQVLGDGEVGGGEWERRSLFMVFGD